MGKGNISGFELNKLIPTNFVGERQEDFDCAFSFSAHTIMGCIHNCLGGF
jgi:hypothetical protein